MKGKWFGIAIAVVALAVIVNVFALKSADVGGNKFSVTITDSTAVASLIQITSPTAAADPDIAAVTSSGGKAVFAINNSKGLQPDSSYTFDAVFAIKNNGSSNLHAYVTMGALPADISAVEIYPAGGTLDLTDSANKQVLNAGSAVNVAVKITVAPGATVSNTADILLTVNVVQ
jgi:hypothetical protein